MATQSNSPIVNQGFTGVPELDLEILRYLSDQDLLNICSTDRYLNNFCEDESFWQERLVQRSTPNALDYKPEEMSWKDYYYFIVTYLPINQANLELAAYNNFLPAVEYFAWEGIVVDDRVANAAAEGAAFQVLEFIEEELNVLPTSAGAALAIKNIDDEDTILDVLDWLQIRNILPPRNAIQTAIKKQLRQVLEWFLNNTTYFAINKADVNLAYRIGDPYIIGLIEDTYQEQNQPQEPDSDDESEYPDERYWSE